MHRWLIIACLLSVAHCTPWETACCQPAEPHRQGIPTAPGGTVVSVSRVASQTGYDVLLDRGTAVDAAIATAFALAVTYPEAGNLGGGGFMLIHPGAGAEPICVDYRETAPAAATREMFELDDSTYTHRAVGVPGTVRGLALAHHQFGRLPWSRLVEPAVRLAADGFVLDEATARSLNQILHQATEFSELQRVFAPPKDHQRWHVGDRLLQPEIAATLQCLADEGPEAFYHGTIARQLLDEMRRGGGLITAADLANYEAKLQPPIHGTYRGHDVYGPPPPSSGGICLVQMLNVLETFNLRQRGRWSADTLHLMAETMRRVYRDRARYLGDADFIDVPGHLTSKTYAAQLAGDIDLKQATPSESLAEGIPLADESSSTTHFSVADADGMVVSNTYTLEQSYGARIVVRGAGFLLNNEMGDFNWLPGHTDRRGRIGTEPNTIAPGKRMLSSMTPTIIARNGQAVLATGSPGGRTIINTVLCVVLNVLEFEQPLRTAVDWPRIHHQWFPDRLVIEAAPNLLDAEVLDELRQRGHRIVIRGEGHQGDAHSLSLDSARHQALGVADHRISGHVAGDKAEPVSTAPRPDE